MHHLSLALVVPYNRTPSIRLEGQGRTAHTSLLAVIVTSLTLYPNGRYTITKMVKKDALGRPRWM